MTSSVFREGSGEPDSEVIPAAPTSEDELIGRTLNDTYVIEGMIGEGGVGRVYQARHTRIKTKRFALKVLHAEHSRDPHQLARFQREAEAAATLTHTNVVGVFDVGRTEDGYSYLACELLSGTDLDAHLEQQGKLDVYQAVSIALQICDALEAAHARNIVHRDLKPQNIFLLNGADGTLPAQPVVKVLDFGLSRFLDHSDAQLTKTGVVMGSPAFMAPEQAAGHRGDHRVDIYGIGVILYCALTGNAPFVGETLAATLVAVMTDEAERPRKAAPHMPEALELIIQRAMAKAPEDRYAQVADLKAALAGVLERGLTRGEMGSTARLPMSSALLAADEDYNLRTSRPRLVLYGGLLLAGCVAFLTSALSGLELFVGPFEFSRTELVLLFLGVGGSLFVPLILAFKRFRRTVWSNSAKVVHLLDRLEGPVLAALVAYGAASLLVRFGDEVLSRFGDSHLFLPEPGLAWPGFTWVFPGVALLAGLSAWLRVWLRERSHGAKLRSWIGFPLGALTVVLAGALLFWGLQWRHARLVEVAEAEEASPNSLAAEAPDQPEQVASAAELPVAMATDAELAQAVSDGVEGLLPLSEKYPDDPRILEPLVLSFASRATGFADAMSTAERLVELAPEKRDSETLGVIVRRAAQSPGQASDMAFRLMKSKLGSAGPDLLYELAEGASKASERASQALREPEIRERMSPALRIALDVEEAEGCEAKMALLERAAALGDLRTSTQLAPLARGSKTGCGRWKNLPCPATCPDHAERFQEAVDTIRTRAAGTQL